MKGVVAAGHPLTAEAGAQVLRAGGNAVDAALAAMVTSFVTEPQLTGLGAGGYMLVAEPGATPALLDFFVAAPGHGADPAARAPLVPAEVYFEAAHPDANIIFGAMVDDRIADQVWVTVVATGYGDRPVFRADPRGLATGHPG